MIMLYIYTYIYIRRKILQKQFNQLIHLCPSPEKLFRDQNISLSVNVTQLLGYFELCIFNILLHKYITNAICKFIYKVILEMVVLSKYWFREQQSHFHISWFYFLRNDE